MSNLCDTVGSKYVWAAVADVSIQPCGCGPKFDLGCLANLSYTLDNTTFTEEKFLNCKSEIIETLKWSVSVDVLGQHNPELLKVLYDADQSELNGTFTKNMKVCFDDVTDVIDIPFYNIDNSVPTLTLPTDINVDLQFRDVDDELRGEYRQYFITNPSGTDFVAGECFNISVEVTGYDMVCSEVAFGRRVKKKFILCIDVWEPQAGGAAPKKNTITFSDVTFNTSLSLPFIDSENGYTRSTMQFEASDKSKLEVCIQSDL